MKLSVMCIVNDQDMYESFLENLAGQKFRDYELITIMNMNGEYSGARQAFNAHAASVRGEYIMFIHPDIRFLDENALGDIAARLDGEMPFGVLGVAGAAPDGKGGRRILTTILQGAGREHVGEPVNVSAQVQTLDECLFIVGSEYFREHLFPDKQGWHLYCVEYCLEAVRNGLVNKVIPSRVWHLSAGKSLDASYMDQLEELIEAEKEHFDLICTTVKPWKTRGSAARAYRKYYYYKQRIKKQIIK